MEQKNWFEQHKKEILIAGGIVITVAGIAICVKYKDELGNLIEKIIHSTKTAVPNVPHITSDSNKIVSFPIPEKAVSAANGISDAMNTASVDASFVAETTAEAADEAVLKYVDEQVSSYVRHLPQNQHPSPAKIAQAAALNINLDGNMTLVDSYARKRVVA